MEFDKSKVLTCVTADQAKAGDVGWLSDTLSGIRAKVERGDAPEEIVRVLPDDYIHRFKPEANAHMLFYPAPYEYLQAKWVEENNLKVGDKVRIIRRWEDGERGYVQGQKEGFLGATLSVSAIRDLYIETDFCLLRYFAIEKVKEEYRPFANAKEFAEHRERWFVSKTDSDVFRVELYNNSGITENRGYWSYDELFKDCTLEDGTPAGVKV